MSQKPAKQKAKVPVGAANAAFVAAVIQVHQRLDDAARPFGGWAAWQKLLEQVEETQLYAEALEAFEREQEAHRAWMAAQDVQTQQRYVLARQLVERRSSAPGKLKHWCDKNPDKIDGDLLGAVIDMAWASAVSKRMKEVADVKHAHANKGSARIPALWAEHKANGLSKVKAAALIAPVVGLMLSTVQRKLKALP